MLYAYLLQLVLINQHCSEYERIRAHNLISIFLTHLYSRSHECLYQVAIRNDSLLSSGIVLFDNFL